jgi:hypothetical protein
MTLREREAIRPPAFKDPEIIVRILRSVYVRGGICEVGSKVRMFSSDAHLLAAAIPPAVEII